MNHSTKGRTRSTQAVSAAKERQSELLEKLEAGIADLTSSASWQRYLDFQSRFRSYSFNNTVLIAMQCPSATRVCGFNAWRSMGRTVRKGEKALWILAPMVYKQTDETSGDEERVVRGFKFVPVFDISATDGDEIPTVCSRLEGEDPTGHFDRLAEVANSFGYRVEDHHFENGCNGDCTFAEKRIRVEVANAPIQRVKTLVHEIAHGLIHEGFANRGVAELEAESIAYVVCQTLGIDSAVYSLGYVMTWAGGGDQAIAELKASGVRIQRAAAEIVKGLETSAAATIEAA